MNTVGITALSTQFGTGQVFWSMLWFFCFFIWIWLLVSIFADIFRSHEMSGLAKALWIILVIVLPLLGVLLYVIVRGKAMTQHRIEDAQAHEAATRQYVQSVAGSGTTSPADEIARLSELKANSVITEEEFQAGKAKVLAQS
jgi:uncharacterized protein with PQ loop repeat